MLEGVKGRREISTAAKGGRRFRLVQLLVSGDRLSCHENLAHSRMSVSRRTAPLTLGFLPGGRRQHFTRGVEPAASRFVRRLRPLGSLRCP